MQHKNVHPINLTQQNQHSNEGTSFCKRKINHSCLNKKKVRQETTACIAQLNTKEKKEQKVTHLSKKKQKITLRSVYFDYFW